MTNLKIKQLKHETSTCKRVLAFMQEENNHLKNRLSDVLKEKFDNKMLDDVEAFQNNFMKEDEVITLLKNELAEIENSLQSESLIDETINKRLDFKMKKLKLNIETAEKYFSGINNEFNSYLSENL
jgi:2-phospho-L-lactate guanylyltransferase (CobY/MobA/RfbA family)